MKVLLMNLIDPVKYSIGRSSRWKGQTEAEAVDFCSSSNQMLCDYETIFPFGQGGEAAGVETRGKFVAEDSRYGLTWWGSSSDDKDTICKVYHLDKEVFG